jgi:predicted Zn-dependent protease
LIRENKNTEALAKLDQALKMEPAQRVLKENTALVELKISNDLLQGRKFADAESHLLRALDIEMEIQDDNFDGLLSDYAEVLNHTGRASEVNAMYKRYGKTATKS